MLNLPCIFVFTIHTQSRTSIGSDNVHALLTKLEAPEKSRLKISMQNNFWNASYVTGITQSSKHYSIMFLN